MKNIKTKKVTISSRIIEDVAMLKQMAKQNVEDHREMKIDLKILTGVRWRMYGFAAASSIFISAVFTLIVAILTGR